MFCFKFIITLFYLTSVVYAAKTDNIKPANKAEQSDIISQKKKFLNILKQQLKSNDPENNDEEIKQLIDDIQNATTVLKGISTAKGANKKAIADKIKDFNKKMQAIKESYEKWMNQHTDSNNDNNNENNVLNPVNNNYQHETELNWERRMRFYDELFKNPLAIENIEVSISNREEPLEQKKLPDAEISAPVAPTTSTTKTIITDEQTILK